MAQSRNQLSFGDDVSRMHRNRGRACTYELLDEIKLKLSDARNLEVACAAVGVTTISVTEWLKIGRDYLERLETGQLRESQLTEAQMTKVDFYIEVNALVAENEIEDLKALDELVKEGDFRAIKFRLERGAPGRWAKREHITIEDGTNQRVSQEPRIVDYSAEIAEAEEFLMLEEEFKPQDITDVEIISEEAPSNE